MITCLTGARFNMTADIMHQEGYDYTSTTEEDDVEEEYGFEQDPDSGEIIRRWKKIPTDDPETPEIDESKKYSFKCIARGIIDGGIRVAGTTERFEEIYANIDYVRITFPANVKLSKRDQVTNIKNQKGVILWREEEIPGQPPTVFNVMGVTPIIDPFGNHIEGQALLERANRQSGDEE